MTPGVRRIVIPLVVLGLAAGILATVVLNRPSRPTPAPALDPAAATSTTGETSSVSAPATAAGDGDAPAASAPAAEQAVEPVPAASDTAVPAIGAAPASLDLSRWRAVPVAEGVLDAVPSLGSLDPSADRMRLELTRTGAGIERIAFSDFWETAAARRQADRHASAVARGEADPPAMPDESLRYVLQKAHPLGGVQVPVLAVHSIRVNDTLVGLFADAWACTGPGRFESRVVDGDGNEMLRLVRVFELGDNSYDVTVRQSVENRSGMPLSVQWIQYGPGDMPVDRARYIDIRRFHFGYIDNPERDPTQSFVLADGQMLDRTAVIKQVKAGTPELWPNAASTRDRLGLSWVGSTNRYFAMAVHPAWQPPGPVPLRLVPAVDEIRSILGADPEGDRVFVELYSEPVQVAPGERVALDMGVYAGPLDPNVLDKREPYRSLNLGALILYLMSGCCTACTFGWLAKLLLDFLSILHDYVLFDWALAIIALVCIVRVILHPLMKRSQVQMHRVTRAMGELKPELEQLQKRYKDDPRKLQAEQLRLYREKGVNPVGCLTGFVPTLLQMPIWIALYAMLYFAWALRQEPAFFGFFQLFGDWPFLADLSAADHFFWEFENPHHFLLWNVTGINLIPILMGLVFFVQQKYMTPPPSATMTPEQIQQQKIMKVMMVVLFPLMLYSAPSGLTLYIMTSSLIGIIEGRRIRAHIDELAAAPPKEKPKKRQDRLGRMYEEALKRAQERAQSKRNPAKKFKKR